MGIGLASHNPSLTNLAQSFLSRFFGSGDTYKVFGNEEVALA